MTFKHQHRLAIALCLFALALPSAATADSSGRSAARAPVNPVTATSGSKLPNIVLVVMDDIGIDQWSLFGYGGGTGASTPNINAIADQGIRFHNMWAMPACSNGRAALYTGRYPFRTGVFTAIGNDDLANYMVNPNEYTIPVLLKRKGYRSAFFGKFHLGLQGNDPYGYAMVHAL